jgi:L-histidine Nalpha-methyltransferase
MRVPVTADARFELQIAGSQPDRRVTMIREVRAGLSRRPRSIPPKYFYDDAGSRLFDAICELPEYYLTRAEGALLAGFGERIVNDARARALVEIGSGMARKTGPLLRALCARADSAETAQTPWYVPFDIAPEPIRRSARELLKANPTLRIRGVVGDFVHDAARLDVATRSLPGPRLFAFLGSTVGNLDETEAPALLRAIARLMTADDRFLLGLDLVKAPAVLHAAYNDVQGVTAAFNKNVLRAVSRELGGDIDPSTFQHLAFYDPERERIEMHLVSTRAQTWSLPGADLRVGLEAGEGILTEISRKFTRVSAGRMLEQGGMQVTDWVTGPGGDFALCVARTAP